MSNKPKETTTVANIVLNEEKLIRGKKVVSGTVLGEIRCVNGFNTEDVDLSIQLNQVKVIHIFPAKDNKK